MLDAIEQAVKDTVETDQVSDQVSDQVRAVVGLLRQGPRSAVELMAEIGLSHRATFRQNYLRPALDAGVIEMTRPDKRQAKNQKYRLTAKEKRQKSG